MTQQASNNEVGWTYLRTTGQHLNCQTRAFGLYQFIQSSICTLSIHLFLRSFIIFSIHYIDRISSLNWWIGRRFSSNNHLCIVVVDGSKAIQLLCFISRLQLPFAEQENEEAPKLGSIIPPIVLWSGLNWLVVKECIDPKYFFSSPKNWSAHITVIVGLEFAKTVLCYPTHQ